MAEVRKKVGRPRKKVEPEYKQNYGHGAGKLMRMKKAGYTMAQIREMKK